MFYPRSSERSCSPKVRSKNVLPSDESAEQVHFQFEEDKKNGQLEDEPVEYQSICQHIIDQEAQLKERFSITLQAILDLLKRLGLNKQYLDQEYQTRVQASIKSQQDITQDNNQSQKHRMNVDFSILSFITYTNGQYDL